MSAPKDRRVRVRQKEVRVLECRHGSDTPGYFYGVMDNVSDSGLLLYTAQLLSEGEEIKVDVQGETCRRAVVRWSVEITPMLFKTGVECISEGEK